MRKTAIVLLTLCLAVVAAPAIATNLLTETFSYPDGALVPNGGWAVYSGTPPTDVQVVSGRAVGNHANAPDDHKLFTPQSLTSKTYACFKVIIPDPAGVPKSVYFAELKDAGAANLVSRVYVVGLVAGGWTFALSHSSTSATVGIVLWSTTSLTYGQEYRVVINYDPVAQSSTMWVDPVDESSTSVSITNTAVPALAVQGFGLRQSGTASTLPSSTVYVTPGTVNWTYSMDNLGVGTTFADACSAGTVDVAPATWTTMKSLYR